MSSDLSFIHLILDASLIVQLVMLSLIVASLVSWTMIFNKRLILKKARNEADIFEERFWSVDDLSPLFTRITNSRYEPTGMEKILAAGQGALPGGEPSSPGPRCRPRDGSGLCLDDRGSDRRCHLDRARGHFGGRELVHQARHALGGLFGHAALLAR